MGAALLMSCGNSSEKMKQLAKENLELSVDYPKQLRVLAVSEPDSAFGAGYFTKDEVKGMLKTMQVVTDTIMKRTDNMSRFNPADHYVVSLAERQMRSMAEIRSEGENRLPVCRCSRTAVPLGAVVLHRQGGQAGVQIL